MFRFYWSAKIALAFTLIVPARIVYAQVTTQQVQSAREVYDRLSPSDKAKVDQAIKDPKIRAELEKMPAVERKVLLDRARKELDGYHEVTILNVPEGPGIPKWRLIEAHNLLHNTKPPDVASNPDLTKLFDAAKRYSPNIVLFRTNKAEAYSNRGIGVGMLISKSLVLTARHVAQDVAAKSADFSIIQIGDSGTPNYLLPLKFVSAVPIGIGAEDATDLGLVRVSGATRSRPVKLSHADPHVREAIMSIGSFESELLPAMSPGIVTTSTRTRDVSAPLELNLKVFGSSLRCFAGISGSPVFDAKGQLIAVVTGGSKDYAPTGERPIPVAANQDWEAFGNWTWLTPVRLRADEVSDAIKKDQ